MLLDFISCLSWGFYKIVILAHIAILLDEFCCWSIFVRKQINVALKVEIRETFLMCLRFMGLV